LNKNKTDSNQRNLNSIEKDHLEPLISEFIKKNTIHKGERAKVQRRVILWSVVDELTKAFI
jgi:hypothetical protein